MLSRPKVQQDNRIIWAHWSFPKFVDVETGHVGGAHGPTASKREMCEERENATIVRLVLSRTRMARFRTIFGACGYGLCFILYIIYYLIKI